MKKIKRIFILLSVLLFSAFLLSCSKKEEESTSVSAEEASGLEGVITNYFQQIEAPPLPFSSTVTSYATPFTVIVYSFIFNLYFLLLIERTNNPFSKVRASL